MNGWKNWVNKVSIGTSELMKRGEKRAEELNKFYKVNFIGIFEGCVSEIIFSAFICVYMYVVTNSI